MVAGSPASPVRTPNSPLRSIPMQETVVLQPDISMVQGAGMPTGVHEIIAQQMLKLRDIIAQDLQISLQAFQAKTSQFEEMLQRLDADTTNKASALQSLRHDFDRQQAQISDLVQSRMTTSAVQEQAARERDLELSSLMQNVRKDVDSLRSQQRDSYSELAVQSDQSQRIDQSFSEMRRELDTLRAEFSKFGSAQSRLERGFSELRKSNVVTKEQVELREKTQAILAELSMHKEHLFSHRDHQQKLETVILDLRREVQGAHAGMALHKDELSLHKDDFARLREEMTLHKDDLARHGKLVYDLQDATSTSAMISQPSPPVEETILAAARHMQRHLQDWEQAQSGAKEEQRQQLSTLEESAKKVLSMGDRLQQLEAKFDEVRVLLANNNVQELTRVVNAERAARIELTQALDTYRYAHLQTCTELRAGISSQNERLNTVEEHDRSMEKIEFQLLEASRKAQDRNDSKSMLLVEQHMERVEKIVKAETDERVKLAQVMDSYHVAHLKTCTEFRKELDELLERMQRIDHRTSEIHDTHQGLAGNHEDHVRQLEDHMVSHLKTCDDLRTQIENAHAQLEIFRTSGNAEKDVERLVNLINSEEQSRVQLEQQLEGSIAIAAEGRAEMQAELELALEKISFLESLSQEQRDLHDSAVQKLTDGVSQLQKVLTDGTRSEALQIQGTLDTLSSSLQGIANDLQMERQVRSREALQLQNELKLLAERLDQATAEERDLLQQEVYRRSSLEGDVSQLKNLIGTASATVQAGVQDERQEMVRGVQDSMEAIEAMRNRITDQMEATAAKDRSWRKEAVRDVQTVLGDLTHISPRASPKRMLPTLATALRLSKAGAEDSSDS